MSRVSLNAAPTVAAACQGCPTCSTKSHPTHNISLKTKAMNFGRRIAPLTPEEMTDANRENHRTGSSGDRAFSRPPLVVLHRGTVDRPPRHRAAGSIDAGTAATATDSSRRARFHTSSQHIARFASHRRLKPVPGADPHFSFLHGCTIAGNGEMRWANPVTLTLRWLR